MTLLRARMTPACIERLKKASDDDDNDHDGDNNPSLSQDIDAAPRLTQLTHILTNPIKNFRGHSIQLKRYRLQFDVAGANGAQLQPYLLIDDFKQISVESVAKIGNPTHTRSKTKTTDMLNQMVDLTRQDLGTKQSKSADDGDHELSVIPVSQPKKRRSTLLAVSDDDDDDSSADLALRRRKANPQRIPDTQSQSSEESDGEPPPGQTLNQTDSTRQDDDDHSATFEQFLTERSPRLSGISQWTPEHAPSIVDGTTNSADFLLPDLSDSDARIPPDQQHVLDRIPPRKTDFTPVTKRYDLLLTSS
eukprot:jgi/Hompol1/5164/HPOL_004185-RA